MKKIIISYFVIFFLTFNSKADLLNIIKDQQWLIDYQQKVIHDQARNIETLQVEACILMGYLFGTAFFNCLNEMFEQYEDVNIAGARKQCDAFISAQCNKFSGANSLKKYFISSDYKDTVRVLAGLLGAYACYAYVHHA